MVSVYTTSPKKLILWTVQFQVDVRCSKYLSLLLVQSDTCCQQTWWCRCLPGEVTSLLQWSNTPLVQVPSLELCWRSLQQPRNDVVLLGAVRVVVQKVYIQRNSAPRGGPLGVSSPSLSLKALGCFGCTLGEGCQASSTVWHQVLTSRVSVHDMTTHLSLSLSLSLSLTHTERKGEREREAIVEVSSSDEMWVRRGRVSDDEWGQMLQRQQQLGPVSTRKRAASVVRPGGWGWRTAGSASAPL